jgi:Zn-dependent peptidase ImmA (M78 family)
LNSLVSFRELDSLGEGLVKDYAKKTHRWNSMCLDIEGFITDYLELRILYESIAEEDKSKLGFMADGVTSLRVTRDRKTVSVIFPKGVIVIEQFLKTDSEYARKRFTLAHEAAHAVLARHIPLQVGGCFQSEFDESVSYSNEELQRMFSMNEACANRLGAAILMPGYRMDRALKKYNDGNKLLCYGGVFPQREKLLIQTMANALGVSVTAMTNRIRELKLLDCQPIDQYIREELRLGRNCCDGG